MMSNTSDGRRVYERTHVVQGYVAARDLQKPERAILERLRSELPRARLLDIGMGGGRTTAHLAPLVREYVGIDYAEQMVRACREQFAASMPNARFEWGDARDLKRHQDGSYDVILFSYNGVDSVNHEERARVFAEMRRVLKPSGWLWFSSHNKFSLRQLFSLTWPDSPRRLPGQIWRFFNIQRKNFPSFRHFEGTHTIVYDGVHKFQLPIYYIDPREQVRVLGRMGFAEIRAFALADGRELLLDDDVLAVQADPWIYYLAR